MDFLRKGWNVIKKPIGWLQKNHVLSNVIGAANAVAPFLPPQAQGVISAATPIAGTVAHLTGTGYGGRFY
jgi:hypothetical protein